MFVCGTWGKMISSSPWKRETKIQRTWQMGEYFPQICERSHIGGKYSPKCRVFWKKVSRFPWDDGIFIPCMSHAETILEHLHSFVHKIFKLFTLVVFWGCFAFLMKRRIKRSHLLEESGQPKIKELDKWRKIQKCPTARKIIHKQTRSFSGEKFCGCGDLGGIWIFGSRYPWEDMIFYLSFHEKGKIGFKN